MNKRIGNLFKGDKVIWTVFFMLCMISIVEVFSASSHLTYGSENFISPLRKHVGMIVAGFLVAIVTLHVPCRFFKLLTPLALAVSLATLVWVLFAGQINGASRWISLFGITLQPSEIAKGTMVLVTAQILSQMQQEDGAHPQALKYVMFVLVPMLALIAPENLSTAALLAVTIFLMMVVGRVPARQLMFLAGIVAGVVVLFVSMVLMVGDDSADTRTVQQTEQVVAADGQTATVQAEGSSRPAFLHRLDTWKGRIKKFGGPEVPPEKLDITGKDMQTAHANMAIVNGRFFGRGAGNSVERDFLPQAFSDFIFAIIVEEMGIEGAIVVVFLYVLLLFRTAHIASRLENNFPPFLAMGLAIMLVTQAMFNMMVAVGLAPVTGQPLPLISKGGTSTIINCFYIGIILSVSRSAKRREQPEPAVAAEVVPLRQEGGEKSE
ncbi:MAG: FtsW/RodA/SpoVE family cell cycle protein [Prevotella sp.]|nr:FtsW/RodA/SpoVE family cell cycle protein [Prevotella sp.]